jgi:O-antigen/teichoic acid export membrane protein
MSARQRILNALAANTLAQVITVLTQVMLTPLYFKQWGAASYGEWLLLSSIPAYLAMADLGIGTAAGNEMTMQAGAGQWAKARGTYLAAMKVAGLATLAVGLLGLGGAALVSQGLGVRPTHISQTHAAWLVLILALTVGLGFFGNVISAAYRAAGANATGIMWGNASRLLEVLGTATLLLAGYGPLAVCSGVGLIKLLVLLAQRQSLYKAAPDLTQAQAQSEPRLIARLLRPSLAFMALPLGNAMTLQGPLLILGSLGSPELVALFSAMRTLARVPVQLANALNASLWPEISRAWGEGKLQALRQLHRQAWSITTLLGTLALVGQWLLGATVSQLWLGPGHYSTLVLNSLALAALLSAIWNVSSVVLAAINAHSRFTAIYLGVNLVAQLASIPAYKHMGMPGLLTCQLLAEVTMVVWVWPAVAKLTGDTVSQFAKDLWRLPILQR